MEVGVVLLERQNSVGSDSSQVTHHVTIACFQRKLLDCELHTPCFAFENIILGFPRLKTETLKKVLEMLACVSPVQNVRSTEVAPLPCDGEGSNLEEALANVLSKTNLEEGGVDVTGDLIQVYLSPQIL